MYYKTIKLIPKHWKDIRDSMLKIYPKSVVLIKSNMLKVLGIDVREDGFGVICLDFYDSHQHMLFLLKYSDIVEKSNVLFSKWDSALRQ